MLNKRLGLMLTLFFCAQALFAQEMEDFNYYADKYKGNTIVNSLFKTHLTISLDKKKGIDVEVSEEERRVYLKDYAPQFSKSRISYSEHYKLSDIDVYTLVPKGEKYKKEKVTDFANKTEFSPGIFHNGSESMNFFYPSLTKGAVSVVKHTLNLSIPQLLSSFYIEDYYPTEMREVIIDVENGVELNFSYVNTTMADYKPTIEETRKGKRYIWRIKDVPAFEIDNDSPDPLYYTPHIIPRIASYTSGKEVVKVLGDLKDLYTWYYSLVEKTDIEPSDDLKAIVDSLVEGKTDELEKIKSIYYWVQDNVRYVAFEEGMEGFIPDAAANVCDKRYGDCKGLSSILFTMMRYANIEAYFTWVGTRDRPYKYEEVPTPMVDNHMILSYKYKGEYFLIDGTSNTSPVTESTAFIQGKEVMIGIDKDQYRIQQVKIRPPEYSNFNDSVSLKILEDGKVEGKGKVEISGFYASRMKSMLKLASTKEVERFMESYLERGSNKFELDTFWLSDISDREGNFIVHYLFNIKDYARINGDELYINLSVNDIYTNENLKKDRKTPYEVNYKSSFNLTVSLEIPENYNVSYLPEDIEFDNELFGCGLKVTKTENSVVYSMREYDNFLILYPESFGDWNIMIKTLKKIYRESVTLKKV